MRKLLVLGIISLFSFLSFNKSVRADSFVVSSSAQINRLKSGQNIENDLRIVRLKSFLESHNSPLTQHAGDLIKIADSNNLDWRLVAAISGVESTFGKRIPKGSYNAYGWANGNFNFESWEHSIEVVSETLREKYYNRGATTLNQIARRYAPPSSTWAWKVEYFMNQIDSVPVEFDL